MEGKLLPARRLAQINQPDDIRRWTFFERGLVFLKLAGLSHMLKNNLINLIIHVFQRVEIPQFSKAKGGPF